jgi:phosphocarrier protein FPr
VIGIVIVSHSASLADGVLELAREMAGPEVRMAAAGGMDLPGRPLGTDAALVVRAIEEVYSEDGVLLLMDLGSAVLSAEMALDLLEPEQRAHVALAAAPLVEGAISAAVQARLGSTLEQALAEADGSLAAKREHLGAGPAPEPQPASGPESAQAAGPDPEARLLRLEVRNRLGLHARPAARLVQTVGQFKDTRVSVRNLATGRGPVAAGSINAIAMLGLACGQTLEVAASGPQAEALLAALKALAEDNFGDPDEGPAAPAAPGSTEFRPAEGFKDLEGHRGLAGLAASSGLALGPVRHPRLRTPAIPRDPAADPEAEWRRLQGALDRTRAQIRETHAGVLRRAGRDAAAMFEAHLLYLDDAALVEPVRRRIFEARENAAAAWHGEAEALAAQYRELPDEYLRARAADVLAVADQVAANVLGEAPGGLSLAGPGILVADDLTPGQTAGLDPALVQAICTAQGGPTSHTAILARTFGIPAIVGLGPDLLTLAEGTPLLVDAERGWLVPDPDAALVAQFSGRQARLAAARAEAQAQQHAPAVTRDGRRVGVWANIGSLADAKAAVAAGAEGVGLLRTEFLFNDRQTAPDEEEQFQSLCAIGEVLGGRPLTVRTLDAGGDKPLQYLDFGQEANPFLGWRAIRMCLALPDFFKVQLRAVVRAAARFPVQVMFPMIATLDELQAAKALLAEAREEVRRAGRAVPERLKTGIMVEIPAAALRAGHLAWEVDFFSIGTNDLTQYTMAAERGNPRVAALSDPFHPAVLDLIRQVADAGRAHGKEVGICGELGGDPLAASLLVGLGLDELSMGAPAIPVAKQLIRALDYSQARARALAVLDLTTSEAVRAALSKEP